MAKPSRTARGAGSLGPRRKPRTKPKPNPPGDDAAPTTPGPGAVEIVPPGEGPGQPPTIDEAIATINDLYRKAAIAAAMAIANYLLVSFLGGDEEALDSAPEHPSLRRIAEHPELAFSAASLWVALSVRRQWPSLPAREAPKLSLTEHRLLLGVTNQRAKADFARRIVRDRPTTRELADEIARWRAGQDLHPVGRPPTDPVVAAVRGATRALRKALEEAEHKPRPGLSRADLPALLDLAERQIERLRERLGLHG